MRSKPFIVAFLLSAVAFPALADMPSAISVVLSSFVGNLAKVASSVILTMLPFWALFIIGRKLGLWDKNYKEEREVRQAIVSDFKEFQRQYKRGDWYDWQDYKMWKHGFTSQDFRRDSTTRVVAREEYKRFKRWRNGQNVKYYVRPLSSASNDYKRLQKADRDFRARRWHKRS